MKKLIWMLVAALLVAIGARVLRSNEDFAHPPGTSSASSESGADSGALESSDPEGKSSDAGHIGPQQKPDFPNTAALPVQWRPEPGQSVAEAIESHLLTPSGVRAQEGNSFVADDAFEQAIAALTREADAKTRSAADDSRARLAAALRTDPRFTVRAVACSARFCLATVSGRSVPKDEDFENLLFTSKAKPRIYAAINSSGPETNKNHDREFRLFFATDPKLNSFVGEFAEPPVTQSEQ